MMKSLNALQLFLEKGMTSADKVESEVRTNKFVKSCLRVYAFALQCLATSLILS